MAKSMAKTVPALQKAIKTMDSVGISGSMGDFEKVFEDMDVKIAEMDGAMDGIYATSIETEQVDDLINEMKAVNNMIVKEEMPNANKDDIPGQVTGEKNDIGDLQARMDALKNI